MKKKVVTIRFPNDIINRTVVSSEVHKLYAKFINSLLYSCYV